MTREDRLHEIDDYVRYLDGVYAKIVLRNARVTVLGFSQGTATASRWTALGSSRVDRLIVWGGEIPPDLDLKRLRVPSLTLVYGTRDEFFTPKIVAATESRLREHKIPYELVPFDGGHEIDEATLRLLT
jgi:predicted esterase